MREIRQSGSEGGGNEQTVSPYPYAFYTCIIQKKRPMGFEDIHQPKSRCVLIPCLCFCLISVKFRVNPWLVFCFLAHPSLLLPDAGRVD